jgi:hypothetical protein
MTVLDSILDLRLVLYYVTSYLDHDKPSTMLCVDETDPRFTQDFLIYYCCGVDF